MPDRYDRATRVLHWLLAVLLLGQLAFGYWLGEVPRNTPERAYAVNLHKSAGMVIGLLILLRLSWRYSHRPPPALQMLSRWQRLLAAATHHVLYLCMAVMPLSGYVASNFSRHGVKFFNTMLLPPWGPDDKAVYTTLQQVHKATAILLLLLVVLHVVAAAWHALRRDGVFARIWLRPF